MSARRPATNRHWQRWTVRARKDQCVGKWVCKGAGTQSSCYIAGTLPAEPSAELCYSFVETVSHNPGGTWSCHLTEDDLELLTFPPPHPATMMFVKCKQWCHSPTDVISEHSIPECDPNYLSWLIGTGVSTSWLFLLLSLLPFWAYWLTSHKLDDLSRICPRPSREPEGSHEHVMAVGKGNFAATIKLRTRK